MQDSSTEYSRIYGSMLLVVNSEISWALLSCLSGHSLGVELLDKMACWPPLTPRLSVESLVAHTNESASTLQAWNIHSLVICSCVQARRAV